MKNFQEYTVRIPEQDDLILAKLAYLQKKSKAALVREGVKKLIEENKRVLQRSDIVVV